MREFAKSLVERVLVGVAGNPGRMAGRVLVLAWHNVVPDAEAGRGEISLHLPLSRFRAQLDTLADHCEIVPLEEIFGPATGIRPRVALTFDDAYRGAVELALPEIRRRGWPVTLFVAPGILGAERLWWDGWSEAPGGLTEAGRSRILENGAGRSTPPEGAPLPRWYHCATEPEVLALRDHGVTLGAHSWSHPNLARLTAEELAAELARPQAWLRERGVPAPMLAYPYGLSSAEVERASEGAGYPAAFRVEGGWMPAGGAARWSLPRFNVPAGLSNDGFRLRLAGRLL